MELTNQQKDIVNYKQMGTLVVKGTAGSGKSLVGLHRINYLFQEKNASLFSDYKKCKILVITFNKVMFYQLKQAFQEIKNEKIDDNDVTFINIDKIMFKEAKKITREMNYEIIGDINYLKSLISKLNIKREKYSDDFIFDEINWIRNNLILKKEEYFNIIRLGRGKKKLNKDDREYIWNILQNYRKHIQSSNKIDYLDSLTLALLKGKLDIFADYNHIIVDEAQDLNKLKLSFIVKLNSKNLVKTEHSLLLLYDSSQNVYDDSWLGYGRPFSSINLDVRGKIKKLETSYRTTRQIHQAANNLISFYKETNIDKETEIKPLFAGTEEGIKPFVFNFENDKISQYKIYSDIIKKITSKTYKYKDIMIISFTNNILKDIENYLSRENIPAHILDGDKVEKGTINLNDNKIKILTINNAKGLESKVVFITDTNFLSYNAKNEEKDENELHIRNSKKIYTAMTRAQELLFISKDSEYISKIDNKYLTEIDNYNDLDIDSYLASDLEENKILINTNKTERFNNIILEYKQQKEEQENIRIENEIKIQKELYGIEKDTKKSELEKILVNLDPEIGNLVTDAETLYNLFKNNSISASIVYVAYSKILEYMLREFIKKLDQGYDTKTTFGCLLGHARKFKHLKLICSDIDNLKIISNRNTAAHNLLKDKEQVKKIRKYIIENQGISKLQTAINEQIKIELKIPEEKIEKDGYLLGNNATVKVNKKEYYSYLIDNDDLAVCKNKLQSGHYKLSGHYTNSRGMKIFVIDKALNLK